MSLEFSHSTGVLTSSSHTSSIRESKYSAPATNERPGRRGHAVGLLTSGGREHFDRLKQEYSSCARCPALCRSRTQVVFGAGNQQAEILLIGEAPGANEDRQGIPFCGMSGQVLNELLTAAGLSREEVFITNTILCRPENNRNPAKEEVENCRKRLDKLIEIMQPKVIVTIGNFATERILGKPTKEQLFLWGTNGREPSHFVKGITSLRGKVFDKEGRKIVPVIHPANYLYSGRNPEMFLQMKKDFEIVAETVRGDTK